MSTIEVRRVVIIGGKIEISVRKVKIKPSLPWAEELADWKKKVKKEKEAKE